MNNELTPKAMATALDAGAHRLESLMRRAKAPPSDIRYLVEAMRDARDVMLWINEYSGAIEKAAKRNVPWRSPNNP